MYKDRREKYPEIKNARREAKELKREEMSRKLWPKLQQKLHVLSERAETNNQAISSSEKQNWLQSMQEELKSLSDTNTLTLVERPKDKNVIPGKWVCKVKTKANGSLENYKARYVAKGFRQIEGIDYFGTFALTSKPETFRLIP